MTNPDLSTRFTMNVQATCTCQMLITDVANKLGYQIGSFSLTYERPENKVLQEVRMVTHMSKVYNLFAAPNVLKPMRDVWFIALFFIELCNDAERWLG